MTIKPWKILESKYLRKEIRLDKCELPNGKIIEGVVLEYGDWATIVALTKKQEVVMVRQYRHGAQRVILELPGGAMELLKKLEGRINHIHLIDSDGTLNEHVTSTHNPFGTGHINFDEMLPALEKANIPTQWWSIDLCFWPGAWELVESSREYVAALLKRHTR